MASETDADATDSAMDPDDSDAGGDGLLSLPPAGTASTRVDLDRLLEDIGPFGRYQKVIYLLICVTAIFPATATLHTVFTAAVPRSRCLVPDCDDAVDSRYADAFDMGYANFTIPVLPSGRYDSCKMYRELSYALEKRPLPEACYSDHFDASRQVPCGGNYVVDVAVYADSMVSEFGLFCDFAYKVPFVQSLFFVGVLLGALMFGAAADWFGRKKTFLVALLIMLGCGIGSALAPNIHAFAAFHFLTAFGQVGVFQTGFILAVECVGKDYRVFCGVVIEFFFVLGECLVAAVAYGASGWRATILWLLVPSVITLFYWPFLPESPRWLVSRKKYVEAQKTLSVISKYNRTDVVQIADYREVVIRPSESADAAAAGAPAPASLSDSAADWLRSPKLVSRSLNLCYSWVVITMAYYGLSMNSASLAGSPYLNFFLVSLVEVPGYGFSYFGMQKWGRRPVMSASLLLGGAACLISPLLISSSGLNLVAFLVGKMGVTCAFGTVYLYTSELYPTTLRTVGIGVSSMCARVGAIVSPYIAALGATSMWIPMGVFGGSTVISGLLCLFLPETLGKELPNTIAEAIRLDAEDVTSEESRRRAEEEEEAAPLIS